MFTEVERQAIRTEPCESCGAKIGEPCHMLEAERMACQYMHMPRLRKFVKFPVVEGGVSIRKSPISLKPTKFYPKDSIDYERLHRSYKMNNWKFSDVGVPSPSYLRNFVMSLYSYGSQRGSASSGGVTVYGDGRVGLNRKLEKSYEEGLQ